MERVSPGIRRRVREVQLVLSGRICERVPDSDGVRKVGRLDEISEAYGVGDVAINPVQYGTGLNIKTIEALGYGMPLVCTPAGARGLEYAAGRAYLLATDDEEFIDSVVGLLSHLELARQLSAAACAFGREWNERQLAGLLTATTGKMGAAHPGRALTSVQDRRY
jgi:glycosyltransferase involved in cell wall biosynthesis